MYRVKQVGVRERRTDEEEAEARVKEREIKKNMKMLRGKSGRGWKKYSRRQMKGRKKRETKVEIFINTCTDVMCRV